MHDKYRGLSDKEVNDSLIKYGSNIIEEKKKENLFKKIINVIKEPMFLLLLCAASIYFITGKYGDGFIMLIFIIAIMCVEFFEEQRTDKAVEELNKLTLLNVRVKRNNELLTIDSKKIVVGDIVLLEEGDKVPADGIILESEGFGVDESLLTGESCTIYKSNKCDNLDHFKKNYCYNGSLVTNGSAVIKITSIGNNTELGKIGKSLNDISVESTPLQKQVSKLVKIFTIISTIFLILVIICNYINNSNLVIKDRIIESILSGITMAMATIPEEIPVILTVFLCFGSLRLAKKNTLIKNNKTIESLSAMTVLCTDKTGTLTENKMEVKDVYDENKDTLKIAAMASEINPYDSMEIAIKDSVKYKNEGILLYEYIFNSKDKMVGKLWNINDNKILCVKGAPETILPLCKISDEKLDLINKKIDDYANDGYRVIAVAKDNNVKNKNKSIKDYNLNFCGLIALSDKLRNNIKKSIQICNKAGVRIIMITGDNDKTALGIAKNIGIKNDGHVITGDDIEKMDDEQFLEQIKDINIFARVYPEQKLRIVSILQKSGEVVCMTGDGINDATALKKADIGIAMGKKGTNVAKEAADIILLDDDFNTIVEAIDLGRNIYTNIVKSISYILIIHIPIALIAFFTAVLKLPNLLLPVHVVLLELLLDPTSSIAFERIKQNNNMDKIPRKKDEFLICKENILRYIIQGVLIFLVVIILYKYLIDFGYDLDKSRTICYTILFISILLVPFNLKNNKSFIINIFDQDKVLLIINLIMISILILFIYLPISHNIFGTCSLTFLDWILIIILSIITILPFEIKKKN